MKLDTLDLDYLTLFLSAMRHAEIIKFVESRLIYLHFYSRGRFKISNYKNK